MCIRDRSEVLKNWNDYINIEHGTTIGSIFNFLKNLDKFDSIADLTQNWWIEEFVKASLEDNSEDYEIEFAIFYKTLDESDLTTYGDFSGRKKDDNDFWAIDSLPMSYLSKIPVVLSENLYERYPDKKEEKKQKWTLGEFLHTFLYNISFFGGPGETKQFMEEMKDQIKRIEAGEEKLYTLNLNLLDLGEEDGFND